MDLAIETANRFLVIGRLRSGTVGRYHVHAMASFVEVHFAVHQCEQRPVTACSHIGAGDELRATLPDQDAAGCYKFTAKAFYAQPLAYTVPSVTDTSLTFLMCHTLCFDFRDFDPCHFLPVSYGPMVPFASFHLERNLLLTTEMLDDVGLDGCIGNGWGADRKLTLVGDEKHPVQNDRFTRFCLKTIHFQRLAGSDTVLLSTSFNYSVHKILLSKGAEIPSN
jgi:hypothetical protein